MHNEAKRMVTRTNLLLGEREFTDPRAQRTTKLDKPSAGAMRPKP